MNAKVDRKLQDLGLETTAQELDLSYQLTNRWSLGTGVRNDRRLDNSPVVPLTQEQGDRTDAVVHLEFDSLASWQAHLFVQDRCRSPWDARITGALVAARIGSASGCASTRGLSGDFGRWQARQLSCCRIAPTGQIRAENAPTADYRRAAAPDLRRRDACLTAAASIGRALQDTDLMSGSHVRWCIIAARNRWNLGANWRPERWTATGATNGELAASASPIRSRPCRYPAASNIARQGGTADTTIADRTTAAEITSNTRSPDWRVIGKFTTQ
jgi:hypothetical protein